MPVLSTDKNLFFNYHPLYSIIRLCEMSLLVGVRVVSLSLRGLHMATWFFTASMPLRSANPFLGGHYQLPIHKCIQLSGWMESSKLVFVVVSSRAWTLAIGTGDGRHSTTQLASARVLIFCSSFPQTHTRRWSSGSELGLLQWFHSCLILD